MCENYAKFVEKRQSRPPGIRLSGVPPPSTIYKNSKNIERTLIWYAKIKTRTLPKNVKIDPQEYVYQGSPPLLSTKAPKSYKELCFDGRKLKHELFRKTSKYTLRNTFIRSPPYNAYKNSKNKDNKLGYTPLLST